MPFSILITSSPGQKHRLFSITAKYKDTDQPRFLSAGAGFPDGDSRYPDGADLYASGQPTGASYYFAATAFCVIDPETMETSATQPAPVSLQASTHEMDTTWTRAFSPATQKATVRVMVAAGLWTEVIRCPFKPGRTDVRSRDDSRGGVHFGVDLHPRDIGPNKAYVDAYDHFPGYCERRLIAVDRAGRMVADFAPWGSSPEGEGPGPWMETLRFETHGYVPNALLPRIAELRLLIRPYQTATFSHVALEPNDQATEAARNTAQTAISSTPLATGR